MILDYNYNKMSRRFYVSYIDEDGNKRVWDKNVARFKSYRYSPTGKYRNWNDLACEEYWTDDPSKFDIKTFIRELPDDLRQKFSMKTFPKLFTFDIECEFDQIEGKSDPNRHAITSISLCSPSLGTVVFGTKRLSKDEIEFIRQNVLEYVKSIPFYSRTTDCNPKFDYVYFETERAMIEYFLKNIVARVPILSGWNCVNFDWWYIVNRIRSHFPDLSIASASCINQTESRLAISNFGAANERLPMPIHTFICDMMEVIQWDHTVMPIKDNVSLDYIAIESLGKGKINYDGDLQDLYENDYKRYVYYNAIDSALVQLINKRFKTIDVFYIYSLYTSEKIEKTFGQIALSEALVWNYFYDIGKKVVFIDWDRPPSNVVGAYVKQPKPGLRQFISCNDFASLYPSTIITTNISFENLIDDDFTEEELERYRKDKNYFVSVNGNVYRTDKDYAFRIIQSQLKENRNVSKYLAKLLDAQVMSDIAHIFKGVGVKHRDYEDKIIAAIRELGYDVSDSDSLSAMDKTELKRFEQKLQSEIEFKSAHEQGMKLMGNAMYGGTGNPSFYWFNNRLANDITGEARNLTLLMEEHLSKFFKENWLKMTDWHKKWNIEVDKKKCEEIFSNDYDPIIYGDTDSLYIEYESLIATCVGSENWDIDRKLKFVLDVNLDFLNEHNYKYIYDYFEKRNAKSIQNFELETVALAGIWLNVKKRYAQLILWKDGKFYDKDDLPLKVKGLEINKSSIPIYARAILSDVVRYMLEFSNEPNLVDLINMRVQQHKYQFFNAPIDEICGTLKLSNYSKYIIDDTKDVLVAMKGTPFQVRAAGNYNVIRNTKRLPGDKLYTGKIKWYHMRRLQGSKKDEYFAYPAGKYPKWADTYAPVARDIQFQQMVLDPLNRIITAVGLPELRLDGSKQISFSLF
jgi:DNA polymerase elongation subunit (family B)